ncbi:MAG: LURP-one-related family protein [Planctomycetota bacterium]
MSRYLMKQNLFSFGDDFIIRNESGSEAFFVDGKVFCLGNQLSFQDMQQRELAYIKQKLLSFGPTYEIHRAGELVAVVTKHVFTLFQCTFTVDIPGPNDLVAQGNFMDHEYTLLRGEDLVATVSKKWFSWTDSYGIEIAPGEDDVLLLASTVVIDMACHPDPKR